MRPECTARTGLTEPHDPSVMTASGSPLMIHGAAEHKDLAGIGAMTVHPCPRCGRPRQDVTRYHCASCALDYGTANEGEKKHRPWWQWALITVGAIYLGLLVYGSVGLVEALLDGSTQSIGFGTEFDPSSGCGLKDPASSFTSAEAVNLAARFDPPLPAGDTVTITVSHDGRERTDLSGTVNVEEGQDCIRGEWGTLQPGQYRVAVRSAMETNMPALRADFAVTESSGSSGDRTAPTLLVLNDEQPVRGRRETRPISCPPQMEELARQTGDPRALLRGM